MNKTVTINISGIIFHIEEDAYERLQVYLVTIRKRFSAEDGRDEIMMDIESRIAEILGERVGPSKQVVLMADVEYVISLMGEPEAIADNEEKTETKETAEESASREEEPVVGRRRRIFRDQDDKVIGGVCSGLGYYFDVDPVWIRIGFVLVSLAFAMGILFYLLLLIIIPKAETTAEKLEMRREPVDVNNISKTIKEEFEGLKRKAEDFGQEAKQYGKKWKQESRNWRRTHGRGQVEDFFHSVFRIFGKIFATALIFFGILFLIGLLTSTFSISSFGPHIISSNFHNLFSDGLHYTLAIIAIFLVFGIPIVMMIYKGIRLLFSIKRRDRSVGIVALALWICGIILSSISIANAAGSFSDGASVYETIPLTCKPGDTLIVKVDIDKNMINDDFDSEWNQRYHYSQRWEGVSINGNDMRIGYPHLDIVPSLSDSVELVIYKTARGRDVREAEANARAIDYSVRTNNCNIAFKNYYSLKGVSNWRVQQVHAELRLPKNTVVYLDPTTLDMLYDVHNTSRTLDRNMTDRRWKMTERGLECVDCAGLKIQSGPNPEDSIPFIPLPPDTNKADTTRLKK